MHIDFQELCDIAAIVAGLWVVYMVGREVGEIKRQYQNHLRTKSNQYGMSIPGSQSRQDN